MRVLSCPRPLAVTSLAVGMLSGNHPSTTPAPARRKRVTSNLYGVSMTAPVKKNPSGRAIRAEFVRAGGGRGAGGGGAQTPAEKDADELLSTTIATTYEGTKACGL